MSSSNARPITILQLYPRDMNIYGDNGNLQVLARRLEWYGYEPVIISYDVGDTLPEQPDIIIGGGGQDSGQLKIQTDLIEIGPTLKQWVQDGVPTLVVCGLYQLFGHFFRTLDGVTIPGVGIFDVETVGTHERLIGNIVTDSDTFGQIVGYENHSGQTFLGTSAVPLASVVQGAGNNAGDGHEGVRFKNAIGTYLHGSLLPKNPAVADFLIRTATERRYGDFSDNLIDDTFADRARDIARGRPR